ncbi:Hpt domain-containing protein [uncultured Pseudodesulfovibrio sp.]|uniref:Hpt domain-containing protein n=1 Tax=uncultured Pseudodesulfovibrio sp. TaxID=2035858 RepID=UPI0029C934A8|nr:Hpt domain-containing protein [uncultured Pseudodesulfovibrio sp.]
MPGYPVTVDPELAPIMDRYLELRRAGLTVLRAAIETGDLPTVIRQGHVLRGSGGSYGLTRLTQLGGAIEDAGRRGDVDEAARLAKAVEEFIDNVDISYQGRKPAMRILMLAINDPAGTAIQFCKALNRYTAHSARLVTLETRYTHGWEKDLHVPDLGPDGMEEIAILMREADVFHFHMTCDENQPFGPLKPADYIKGKTVVHHHHGHHDFRSDPESFRAKYRKLGRTNLLVSTPDLLKLLPEARWQPNLVPIDDPLLKPMWGRYDDPGQLKVCHSPTRKDLKNTDEFLAAVKYVNRRNVYLSVDMIDDAPNHECLARKRRCHALFDHMQGYYGVSSLEGLSQGLAVIAALDEWNRARIGEFAGTDDLPWLTATNQDELADLLLRLALDREYCEQTGEAGRSFMEACWSDRRIASDLATYYESL